MKKIFILGFIVLSSLANAQKSQPLLIKRADKYFNQYAFAKAISLYEEFLATRPSNYAQLKLAESYVKLNDPNKASSNYAKVITDETAEIEAYHFLNYAQSLSSVGNYTEAKKWYIKYQEVSGNEGIIEEKLYGIEHLNDYFSDSARYKVSPFEGNSTSFDFAPTFYKDGIVFASSRKNETYVKHRYSWNMDSFLDLYKAEPNDSTKELTNISGFHEDLNTNLHEGAASFNWDFSHIYFSRNNLIKGKIGKSSDGINKINLYHAKWTNDEWIEEELHFDSTEYSTGDPFITKNMQALYFVSDMPGGLGGTDIYKVEMQPDGSWSDPVNLGSPINTSGNERTPFIAESGNIYFASDGHYGLGGLDLYRCELKDGQLLKPEPLSFPVNTNRDDFGLILDKNERSGYFTSNRPGGMGEDDIYRLTIAEEPKVIVNIKILSKIQGEQDDTRRPLIGSFLKITDQSTGEIIFEKDNSLPVKSIHLKTKTRYLISTEKDGLSNDTHTLDLRDVEPASIHNVVLTLIEPLPNQVRVKLCVLDDQGISLKDAQIYVFNEETKEINVYSTDITGCVEALIDTSTQYVVKGIKTGYFTNCISFYSGQGASATLKLDAPLSLEKIDLNKSFEIELFFDLAKYNIRPDAALELDRVVAFLNENPGLQVELGSHTDCRGSDSYNQRLSQQRAESSVAYIVSKGIDSKYITAKGYGETKLKNHCSNGVRCSADEHQINRRTEIKVTGILEEDQDRIETNSGDTEMLKSESFKSDCEPRKILR